MKKLQKQQLQLLFGFPSNKLNPYDPTTFGYIKIGVIISAHGVHGWCKIYMLVVIIERSNNVMDRKNAIRTFIA